MANRTNRIHRLAVTGAASVALSGCVTDPAFLEGLALATDAIAAETAYMAEEARCYRRLSMSGEWMTFCPLPDGYVAPPVYAPPSTSPRRDHRPGGRRADRPKWY